jgi:hypothetical protein
MAEDVMPAEGLPTDGIEAPAPRGWPAEHVDAFFACYFWMSPRHRYFTST